MFVLPWDDKTFTKSKEKLKSKKVNEIEDRVVNPPEAPAKSYNTTSTTY